MMIKLVFVCSFVLAVIVLTAQNAPGFRQQLINAHSQKERLAVLSQIEAAFKNDSFGISEACKLAKSQPDKWNEVVKRLEIFEQLYQSDHVITHQSIDEILKQPQFRERGEKSYSNWLETALGRLFRTNMPPKKAPDQQTLMRKMPNLSWTYYVFVGLLIVMIFATVFIGLRHFKLVKSSRSQRKSILDADEPDRALDEWLALAEDFETKSLFREAVRCLYVAILLRLDKAQMVRFVRTDTNWEHLERILRSQAPNHISYKHLTLIFDSIWYGNKTVSDQDYRSFKEHYQALTEVLERSTS